MINSNVQDLIYRNGVVTTFSYDYVTLDRPALKITLFTDTGS